MHESGRRKQKHTERGRRKQDEERVRKGGENMTKYDEKGGKM